MKNTMFTLLVALFPMTVLAQAEPQAPAPVAAPAAAQPAATPKMTTDQRLKSMSEGLKAIAGRLDALEKGGELKSPADKRDAGACEQRIRAAQQCLDQNPHSCDVRAHLNSCGRSIRRVERRSPQKVVVRLKPVLNAIASAQTEAEQRHTEILEAVKANGTAYTEGEKKATEQRGEIQTGVSSMNTKLDDLIRRGFGVTACNAQARTLNTMKVAGAGEDQINRVAKSLGECISRSTLDVNAVAMMCLEEGLECDVPMANGRTFMVEKADSTSKGAYAAVKWVTPALVGAGAALVLCSEQDEDENTTYDCGSTVLGGALIGVAVSAIWEAVD